MKQLITDQLIEEYQRELESTNKKISETSEREIRNCLMVRKDIYHQNISRLQSLRQQEMYNVMTAYKEGDVLKHLYEDSKDYFNQTFKQPQP